MRYGLIVLWMLFCASTSAIAQVNVSIGINLQAYPQLVPVPGYPVYYAPQLNSNYFFYDGMYWVYQEDNWYASSWYNGPWGMVAPDFVPLFVLRVPVRYYRVQPSYFYGWRANAPPRWGEHWGDDWEQHRRGWDHWNRRAVSVPAPLPTYQRRYSGDQYPRGVDEQQDLRGQNYRYQPRDALVRQHNLEQIVPRAAMPAQQGRPQESGFQPQENQRPNPQQRGGEDAQQRTAPPQGAPRPRGPAVQDQRPDQRPDQRQNRDREKSDERGPDRNR